MGLTSKVFLTKELDEVFRRRYGVLAGQGSENRKQSGPFTGRSTKRGQGSDAVAVYVDDNSPLLLKESVGTVRRVR
jgi:hypothetical protein